MFWTKYGLGTGMVRGWSGEGVTGATGNADFYRYKWIAGLSTCTIYREPEIFFES